MKKRYKGRRVKRSKLYYLVHRIILGSERRRLLERFGWYQNLTGGWTHPHCMDYMSPFEVRKYTAPQLEYKLQHGSNSTLPDHLR